MSTKDTRHVLNFPSKVSPIYAVAPGASVFDLELHFEGRLAQLSALLVMTYGVGGEAFRGMNNETQDGYMWACSSIADELRALHLVIGSMRSEGRAK